MTAVRAVVLRQPRWRNGQPAADGLEILGEIFEAHDVVEIGERVLFAVVQSQIVRSRYSFENCRAEFFPAPSFRILCRREVIRHHPIPRISHTRELVQISKLLAERVTILAERRMFPDLVLWIAQSETL